MKYVSKREKYSILRLSLLVALPLVLLAGLISLTTLRVSAADNIIEVTTTADEDESPGTGCSLYEAILAASTNTAYGGCDSGSATDRDVISLPAGTYSRDAEASPNFSSGNPSMLYVDDISIIGAGNALTIIDGYGFILRGDAATSIESLTLLMSSSYNYPTYLDILGSNKTISNVDMKNGSMVPIYLTFMTDEGQTIQNVNFNNFRALADLNANVPATVVDCSGDGTCDDISFNNSVIQSNYSTAFSLSDVDHVSLTNTNITTLNTTGMTVEVGDNAIVDNVEVGVGNPNFSAGENSTITSLVVRNGSCGSNTVTIKAGTTIDGLEQRNGGCGNTLQFSGSGSAGTIRNIQHVFSSSGTSYFNLPTSLIDGFSVNNGSLATFNDDYEGSTISNINITSSSTTFGSSTFQPASLSSVNVVGDTSLDFQINHDNAELSDIYLRYTGSGSSYPSASITGENVSIDDMSIIKDVDEEGGGQGVLNIVSGGSTISNLKMLNSYVDYDAAGDFTLENFTITGPSHLEAVMTEGVTSATVRKGYIVNARGGLALTANPSDTTSALVENVKFSNMGSLFSTNAGAIITTNIDQVNIRKVSAYRIIQDFGAPINIYGGNTHSIENATIVDSSGGIFTDAGSYSATPMNVGINNVTVYNNEDSTDHDNNILQTSLIGVSENSRILNLNVKNSAFGGTSLYTSCVATDDVDLLTDGLGDPVNINMVNSFATDSSCIDMGFSELADFGMATTLANNSSIAGVIGYNGESGVVQTLALDGDSSLLLAGDSSTCATTDARGFTRDLVRGCDVGAYQLNVAVLDDEDTPPSDETGTGTSGGSTGNNTNTGSQTSQNTPSAENEEASDVTPTSEDKPATTKNTQSDSNDTNGESESSDATFTVIMVILGSVTGLSIIAWVIKLLLVRS